MSLNDPLDTDELANVPVLCMKDVQAADTPGKLEEMDLMMSGSLCSQESQSSILTEDEVIETCVIDGSEIDYSVGDDDSNMGSLVSDVTEKSELIVPEILDESQQNMERALHENNVAEPQEYTHQIQKVPQISGPESWPTLEILPGGVINLMDKTDFETKNLENESLMIYACAKCPERFKYLVCLVKHVKSHEDKEGMLKKLEAASAHAELVTKSAREKLPMKRRKMEIRQKHWRGIKDYKKAEAVNVDEKTTLVRDKLICLRNGKIKIIPFPKGKKPKTS